MPTFTEEKSIRPKLLDEPAKELAAIKKEAWGDVRSTSTTYLRAVEDTIFARLEETRTRDEWYAALVALEKIIDA